MNKRPLITVVVPSYNRANKIADTLKSIQAQTYQNWETIVVDDGSKDNTVAIVEAIAKGDNRIHVFQHERNKGAQAARNTGIKAAKGEWIAFLDSDDEWLPDSLKMRLDYALKNDFSVVYSLGYIIYEDNRQELYRLPDISKDSYRGVLAQEGPMFQSLLVKKEILEKIGYLDETAIAYQEWNTSIRLAKLCTFGFLEIPTFIYDYRTPGAISRNHSRNGRAYADIVKKFFWEMLMNVGPEGMAFHYLAITNWYRQAGALDKVKFYNGLAFLFKCFSLNIVGRKIKSALIR